MDNLPRFAALIASPPPPLLYHYTSPGGLDGILRNKKLWASSLEYLNDSAELGLPRTLIREQLLARAESRTIEGLSETLRASVMELQRIEEHHACAFSLSAWGDLLSQWVAYCPRSGGFSVGFDAPALRTLCADQGMIFGSCVYDKNEQAKLVGELVDKVEGVAIEMLQTSAPRGQELARLLAPGLFAHFTRLAPFIKHGSFAQEAEWRLVFSSPKVDNVSLEVRVGSSMLIPYAAVDLIGQSAIHPIREIIVGPCAQPDLALRAASLLADVCNVPSVTCRKAWVSYRAL